MLCFMNKWKKNQSGYVSIEAIFAVTLFLMFVLLTIGFFTYLKPYTDLSRDVHGLATIAERQGGLTKEDIALFKSEISNYHYLTSTSKVVVTAKTIPSGKDVTNVTPIDEDGNNYVRRSNKELIEIQVEIPANHQWLNTVSHVFSIHQFPDAYTFKETVLSERY